MGGWVDENDRGKRAAEEDGGIQIDKGAARTRNRQAGG